MSENERFFIIEFNSINDYYNICFDMVLIANFQTFKILKGIPA